LNYGRRRYWICRRGRNRLFRLEQIAASAGQILDGLLGNDSRKTGSEAADDPDPKRQQAILDRRSWDANALCELVLQLQIRDRRLIVVQLGANDGKFVARRKQRRIQRSIF
jgi:hypothetical protein